MRIPLLGVTLDERFFTHRLRSTSLGGLAGCFAAFVLFEYHLIRQHVVRWDLASIVLIAAAVKVAAMLWYRFRG